MNIDISIFFKNDDLEMANNLAAEKDGKVTAICVKVGESVMEDDALIVIE